MWEFYNARIRASVLNDRYVSIFYIFVSKCVCLDINEIEQFYLEHWNSDIFNNKAEYNKTNM